MIRPCPDDDTLAQQEPQQPQPSQRAQDMAALGYEPATIVDDQGAVVVAYFTKTWTQPVAKNEI